jgi:hypothetical protein
MQRLVAKPKIHDLRNGGQHSYVSARRLFWVIRELQAVANGDSTQAREPSAESGSSGDGAARRWDNLPDSRPSRSHRVVATTPNGRHRWMWTNGVSVTA